MSAAELPGGSEPLVGQALADLFHPVRYLVVARSYDVYYQWCLDHGINLTFSEVVWIRDQSDLMAIHLDDSNEIIFTARCYESPHWDSIYHELLHRKFWEAMTVERITSLAPFPPN